MSIHDKIKNFISSAVCIALAFSVFSQTAFAVTQNTDIVAAKQAMVESYKANYKNFTDAELKLHRDKVDSTLAKLVAKGEDLTNIESQISEYGVYRLKTETPNKVVPMSTNAVTMSTPTIWYDSQANEWDIVAGGYYRSAHLSVNFSWSPFYGWRNMGGPDTVGFSLNNTYGSYKGVSCIGGYGYITDHNGREEKITSPLSNDYSKGIYYLFQDQVYFDETYGLPQKYFGEGFAALGRYTSNFANYHGNCEGFYGHTWSSTSVTGVSLSNSGFSINFSSTSNRTPYNSFDTGF